MKAVALGHACVDITPRLDLSPGIEPGILYPVGPLRFALGGSAINTARKLHELGTSVSMAIATGQDTLTLIYERLLHDMGVPMQLIPTGLTTSYSIVVEHGHHDRTFWQHEGFNAAFDARQVDLDTDQPDLVHAGYPSLVPFWCHNVDSLLETFTAAQQRGITTSLDLAHVGEGSVASTVDWAEWFRQVLPAVDVMSPSWDDVSSAFGLTGEPTRARMVEVADMLLEMGVAVVQLSAGKEGFLLRTAGTGRLERAGRVLAPVAGAWADQDLWFDAEVIDEPETTVGAGDSLTAGLLHALGMGLAPVAAGEFARAVVGRHLRGERAK
ncbi:hypothetical protein GCM10025789_02200 [Tessaracoccus lubricantis]|uniref:Carbohydrate kinase PfkB domain-containing protein n=1 Tax=Tessaracoccus lubricantis TaxID=545543 RepID=A0ABP9EWY4_9ACTN